MNIEQQRQGVTYQLEFDFSSQAEWGAHSEAVRGRIPLLHRRGSSKCSRRGRDKRLLEHIAAPGNLRRAYRKVKSNGGAAGVEGMTIDETSQWLR